MHWWIDDKLRGHLDEVLAHCNEALRGEDRFSKTLICDLYFRALNKYWNAFQHHAGELARGDISSFVATLKAMPDHSKIAVLQSEQVQSLIRLNPPVMNHDVLKRRGYVPGQELTDSIKHEATEEHRKAQKAFDALIARTCPESIDRALKKLAELLYVIRSNIAHGEKTPYGPDREKVKRDRLVSAITLPVQKLILDLLLDRPSHKLVAYGTLQPGGCNAEVLAECGGRWEPCMVNGELSERNGLAFFQYCPVAPPVSAMLLTTAQLANFWPRLDGFEGAGYVRQLIFAQIENGCAIAQIYEQRG